MKITDKMRLDFLRERWGGFAGDMRIWWVSKKNGAFRESIDAAMRREKKR